MKINVDLIYPIGSIYMSTLAVNPETLFGGKWEKIEGCFLLGSSSAYSLGSTGGEATHKLTVQEMPSHTHRTQFYIDGTPQEQTTSDYSKFVLGWGKKRNFEYLADFVNTGGDQPHNNMPPYLVVNIWKRTA